MNQVFADAFSFTLYNHLRSLLEETLIQINYIDEQLTIVVIVIDDSKGH